jgi:hypothetical protein
MFQTPNDFAVQASSVAGGTMLQLFVELFRNAFDRQVWHGGLLVVPLCNQNGSMSRAIFSLFWKFLAILGVRS